MTEESPSGLTGFVVTHVVAVTMTFLAVLVFGFVGYLRLPIELMPDISYPTITVRTAWDGAAPQELENRVSQPIEEALATLDGLVTLQSRSRAGSSDVVLGFDWGTDMAAASQSIRENLQTTRLPDGADRPLILRYDPSLEPFMRLALSSDAEGADPRTLARLRAVAELEVKRELEAMSGIAAVRVRGGFEREVGIRVREDWMVARQLTLDDVQRTLAAENINIAGGSVYEGDSELLVRTLNEYASVDELHDLTIRRNDGVVVPLTDVAVIEDGHKEREVLSRLEGRESVELEIFKEAGANIVEVADRVRVVLDGNGAPPEMGGTKGLKDGLPEGMTLVVLDDQAGFIADAVGNLRSTALVGGLFAVLVLFLFLRDWRATGIIGLAIPVSVVIGFAPLYLWGVSLNLMSLGGLALGVGMLVDNAVVVLESIQRYREDGLSRKAAAAKGTADVGAAVIASTLTTVAVFAPIAFVEGVAGELFGDLALAVVSSLLASLAVALLLVPTLAGIDADVGRTEGLASLVAPGEGGLLRRAARSVVEGPRAQLRESFAWMRERLVRWAALPYVLFRFVALVLARALLVTTVLVTAVGARVASRVVGLVVWLPARVASVAAGAFGWVFDRVARLYGAFLDAALQHGTVLALGAVALFVLSLLLVPLLGTELIPEVHQGRFAIDLALPVGTPLSRTERVSAEAEAIALAHPEVRTTYATVGTDRRADARAEEGENTARIRVELEPGGNTARKEARVMEVLRGELRGLGELKMSRPSLFSVSTPVEVVLFGQDLDQLREVGDRVAARLGELPGLADVRSSLLDGHPEIRIAYDRQRLHRLGLDPASVAKAVRDKVQGVVPTAIRQGAERIDLRVQLVESHRDTLDDLRRLNINPALKPVIPLEAAASLVEAVGPSEIRRYDQQRAVVVSANLAGFDLGSVGSDIDAALQGLELPPEITWTVAGQSSEMRQSLSSLQFALALAVFLVYVIMASTFENLGHPFVILFSIPLALVGVVPGLLLTGQAVSVVVFIGLIVLAGVVVNNAIVLVDTINRRRDEGTPALEAVKVAGRLRLRPILITTATTVLGLLPLALGIGAGAEIQQPLAITIIAGLSSSTVLTLVVVPVVYTLFAGVLSRDAG
ncbi:MAG: efflux RND transporter permease subunit [Alphaproteobacteria bacterium]|nr:efflux RND transporter permease subunit [Alphaproteobacteria bacterium]